MTFCIIRKQLDTSGEVVDIKKLVNLDGSGIPSFVSIRSQLIDKFFTDKSWALKNLNQCREYFEKNPPEVKFEIEMLVVNTRENTNNGREKSEKSRS